mgnify:FL=1
MEVIVVVVLVLVCLFFIVQGLDVVQRYFDSSKSDKDIFVANTPVANEQLVLKNELNIARSKVSLLQKELNEQSIKVAELQKSANSYKGQMAEYKWMVDAKETQLSIKEKEIEKFQFELTNKKSIIQGLNCEKNELADSLKIAQEENSKADRAYSELYEKCDACEEEIERLNKQIDSFDKIINNKNPFDYVAHLRAHALKHVHEYVGKNVEELAELFKYQYKFEYLLSIYPELRAYKNDDAYINYMHEEEKRCNIKNWLTDEEYNHLSEVGREQLAVDRYITSSSKWTDWEKGRNYEIYCAYILFNEGYDIIQEGLNKKLEDKGRDIIAVHQKTGKTLIVQCKNWIGYVRENIVFQLFGSYAQWLVDNDRKLGDKSVEAWLYVTGPLSDEAQRCAQKLDVHVRHLPMDKFPAIKCNVNHNTGQLIYHFPFDRHYDLVKINARGKGYKFSVAEAINEGFRRAYNH